MYSWPCLHWMFRHWEKAISWSRSGFATKAMNAICVINTIFLLRSARRKHILSQDSLCATMVDFMLHVHIVNFGPSPLEFLDPPLHKVWSPANWQLLYQGCQVLKVWMCEIPPPSPSQSSTKEHHRSTKNSMTRTKLQLTALCVYFFFLWWAWLYGTSLLENWTTSFGGNMLPHSTFTVWFTTHDHGETTQLLEMMEIRLKDDELVNRTSRQL